MDNKSNGNTTAPKAPRPAASAPSIIGADVRIVGDISTSGEIQLDGIVEGDLSATSVTMGEHGSLEGTIVAEKVTIKGHLKGSLRGRSVVIERSGRVSGDVYHETLSIEAGAVIDGKFTHIEDPIGNKAGSAKQTVALGGSTDGKTSGMQVVENVKTSA